MNLPAIYRRAINRWQNWRSRKAIERAYPGIAELRSKSQSAQSSHSRNPYRKQIAEAMTAILAGHEQ